MNEDREKNIVVYSRDDRLSISVIPLCLSTIDTELHRNVAIEFKVIFVKLPYVIMVLLPFQSLLLSWLRTDL